MTDQKALSERLTNPMLMLSKSFTNMVIVAKEADSSTNGDTGKSWL